MATSMSDPPDLGIKSACRVADLLLDMGAVLLVSGAHCGRINRNIDRVAETWGFKVELFITFTGLMVSIKNISRSGEPVARFLRTTPHGVHFGILTEISLLTWQVMEKNLGIDEVEARLAEIKKLPHHPRWLVLPGVGAACACLCLLLGGDGADAGVTFVAAVCGMFVRQETLKMRFNPMIAFIAASFATALVASSDVLLRLGAFPETALAASVLYLVPGVPLINCVIDLIEGYVPTAIARGVYGGFILLCIAVGMSLAIFLLGIQNF